MWDGGINKVLLVDVDTNKDVDIARNHLNNSDKNALKG